MITSSEPEPKGSEGSSSDSCVCGHTRSAHIGRVGDCLIGAPDGCDCEQFEEPDRVVVVGGPRAAAVCIGSGTYLKQPYAHSPTLRSSDGRCFQCEPPEAAETVDERNARERADDPTSYEASWRAAEEHFALPLRSAAPLPAYAVVYAVAGGQQYEIVVPGDASVVVEDGMLMVIHPQRPALGIASIRTQPTLTRGEEQHATEAESHGH